ncbi:MAG: FkbM family methyltransferase [Betaproteobacteria bacterium HGW-Betaproteobacteria-11]|nr:MAG: FkbM family methyltransferase [Betaproteobacteria bacterium HGW-Betaproteobacteria-11]
MKFLKEVGHALRYRYRLYIKRDPFVREVQRWFNDRGDQTLRLAYPLDSTSLVLDVGGYQGDFANQIHERYGCRVLVFEPVEEFYRQCKSRFSGNEKIEVFNYGLGATDALLPMEVCADGSRFSQTTAAVTARIARLRKIDEALPELGVDHIDLLKINIEGGEYDLLEAIIISGWIEKVRYLQVQFHNFVDRAEERRLALRAELAKTHTEMWNYEFVWESWRRR